MSGFNYERSKATALRLITKFGQTGTLTRHTAGTGGRPWEPVGDTVDVYEVRIAALPASKGTIEAFDIRLDDNLVMQNVRFAYMAVQMKHISGSGADSITPKPTDVLEFNGEKVTILGTTPLNPAGTPVYYPVAGKV